MAYDGTVCELMECVVLYITIIVFVFLYDGMRVDGIRVDGMRVDGMCCLVYYHNCICFLIR